MTYYSIQAITISRIPLAVAFAGLLSLAERSDSVLILGLILIVLIEATDFIDGLLARHTRAVTEVGALLDPYSDSVSRIIVYWGLATSGLVYAFTPLAMAFRDVTVAYSRILLIKYGQSGSARLSGKIKAVFQAAGAVVVISAPLYWQETGAWIVPTISWTVAIVTLASAVEYILDAVSAVKRARISVTSLSRETDRSRENVG